MTKRPDLVERNKLNAKYKNKNLKIFKSWDGMKDRCNNPNNKDYKNYGGRGIKVCSEWKNDFNIFQDWAMNNGWAIGLTIDRIDVNGNYEPDNCRWVDMKKQANNRRNNKFVTYNNETHTISEWADITKIPRKCLEYRVRMWSDLEKVFNRKVTKNRHV